MMNNKMLGFSTIVANAKENKAKITVIIGVFFLLGILVGTLTYFKQLKDTGSENTAINMADTNVVYVLSEDEFSQFTEDTIEEMYRHKDYYDSSVWMHMNPYEIYTEKVYMKLDLKDKNYVNYQSILRELRDMYKAFAASEECYEYVCDKAGIDFEKKYLDELISFEGESAIMSIQVVGDSREMAISIADALETFLAEKQEFVQNTVYPHEISTFLQESTITCDPSLDTKQRTERMFCAYYYGSGTVEAIQNTFRLITDFNANGVGSANNAAASTPAKTFLYYACLYGAMSIFAGALLAAVYILLKCAKDQRIYDYKEYCEKEGVECLMMAEYGTKDSLFLFDLKNLLDPYNGQGISVVCPQKTEVPEAWKECIGDLKMSLQVIDDCEENVEHLEKVMEAENILFVCKKGKTTYREMDFMMKRIEIKNIQVCGMVVI